MSGGQDVDTASAARALSNGFFNLLRRGSDGSLTLSADHWRLAALSEQAFEFVAREPHAPPLHVDLKDIVRLAWDRLPKQRTRSQMRFYLANGDTWTFSGTIDETALQD